MMLLEDLLVDLAASLSGTGHAARVRYGKHVEALASRTSTLPAQPSSLQVTHIDPLVTDTVEWEGDLYLRVRDGKVFAEFAPDGAPRRRGKGVGHLRITHKAGQPPEAVGRIRDAQDDALETRLADVVSQVNAKAAETGHQPDPAATLIEGLKGLITNYEREGTDG